LLNQQVGKDKTLFGFVSPRGNGDFVFTSDSFQGGEADVVVASLVGDATRQTFEQMARALAHAARVVKPNGKLVLLCETDPDFGAAGTILREEEEPHLARQRLLSERPPDLEAGLLWLDAVARAKIYTLSQASPDTMEELFATPLEKPAQVLRILGDSATFVLLPDAHKTRATLHREP
jgi:hypothetical protein